MPSLLRRWLAARKAARRPAAGAYFDPFFADARIVEDDYRRLSRPRNEPAR
jgi:hypothetical protein